MSTIDRNKLEENCNNLLFKDLCHKFERIEKTKTSNAKLKLLFNTELKQLLDGQSVFPLMRLVLPLNDSERHKYGLKQASVAKTYADALQLNRKTSKDAQRLIFWKDPTKAVGASAVPIGDFGAVLEDVLKSRVQQEPSCFTIGQVNSILDELADASGENAKAAIIRDKILNYFNANEQKWFVRIVFQDLKIGLKHEQVLKFFSPTALQRYNECTDLKKVCEEEGSGSSLHTQGLQLFSKFSPMLAKGFPNTGQIVETEKVMKGNGFIMETKLDG
eukprot:gene3653-7280_t